ncbi:MAG TPA: RNA polymerase sigma factor [Acidimicrobiales bacterium]|nr:RNA polymerase sigma factor [Acidimicrobiales bacterium]
MALRVDDVDLDRDRTLVRRFQAGDNEAFDELYRRYYDRLERFCERRVGDRHTAEELAQEAFARALTALPDLGGDLRFYPWMSVIAAHLCVDSHRRRARSEPAADPDPGPVAGGQEDVVDAVDVALVVTALRRLAPRHQDVLQLREVEGWSYRRIADHYGVTVGTVETLLFRARRALRREFRIIEGGSLASLPVVAWVAARAGRLRLRIPKWLPTTASPGSVAAAAATATAAAVAIVMVPGPGATPPPPPSVPAVAASAPRSPANSHIVIVAAGASQPTVTAVSSSPTTAAAASSGVVAGGAVAAPGPSVVLAAGSPAAPTTSTTTGTAATAGASATSTTGDAVSQLGGTVQGVTSSVTVPPVVGATLGGVLSALPQAVPPVALPAVGVTPAPVVGAVNTTVNGVIGGVLSGH